MGELYNSSPLVRGTPLKRGQVIDISQSALVKANDLYERASWKKDSLLLGHMAQYTHDEILSTVFSIYPSADRAPYDRHLLFDPRYHDDKVATFETDDGKISKNHNITHGEFDAWMNNLRRGIDTVIHSFEYVDPTYRQMIYKGSISFRLLEGAGRSGIREGKESYFFDRELAYKYNLL